MKAAVSISNPFDVLSCTVRLKYKSFGIYDRAIAEFLTKPFLEKKFKHKDLGEEVNLKMKTVKSLLEFDNLVRAKILGYNSSHTLYRNVSCDRFVGDIDIPFLVLHSKDDPICTN